jgi:hypothetical protein
MKAALIFLLNLLFVSGSLTLFSQESCKVLKPEIAGTYDGKCKNGLAHGKGIAFGTDRYEGQFSKGLPNGSGKYTWQNGSVYIGEWSDGERNGIGRYIIKTASGDSIQDGMWNKDTYMGPKPQNPYVSYKTGVDRYSFQKNNTIKKRVLVDIYQNGIRNRNISNFTMSTTSGSDTKVGESVGYDYIIFPVMIKIRYTARNKLNTISYDVQFEFEIYEPGDWTVTLNN